MTAKTYGVIKQGIVKTFRYPWAGPDEVVIPGFKTVTGSSPVAGAAANDEDSYAYNVQLFGGAAGVVAGRFKVATDFIPFPFSIEGVWIQSMQWGGGNLSFNLFLTEFPFAGEAGLPFEALLIPNKLHLVSGVFASAFTAIGPIVAIPAGANGVLSPSLPILRCPQGRNKRIGVVISQDGASGANTYLSFTLNLRRI